MEIHQKISMPNYQNLKTMVKKKYRPETPIAELSLTPGTGKSKQEQWSRVERAQVALKEEKAFVTSGKKKASVRRGHQCSFRHESDDRAPTPTSKASSPSEPSMTRGRSVSRKRSVSGRSQIGRILQQPCTYFLKGTCTRSRCEYLHPPECQFYKTESGCKAGDKCLFAHYKIEEQPSKKPNKSFQNGESDDKGAVAVCENCATIGLCLASLRAVRTSEKNEVSGKPEAKSFGINSTGTIHTVCATSSKCPRK